MRTTPADTPAEMSDERTVCRTPNAAGVTRIPSWKFNVVREAILAVMAAHDEGVSFKDLRALAKAEAPPEILERLGSWGWHFTTVKLEMEAAGEIARAAGVTPQRLIIPPRGAP